MRKHEKCEGACNKRADYRDETGKLACARHAVARDTCGHWRMELDMAQGLHCAACVLAASGLDTREW